ncbi:MAG: homoserine dehydrogenase [Candidatus Aminicenantes bacterium]|nr:homoserine dehydrogenase [Candidatus Aminicenantes bacterium]
MRSVNLVLAGFGHVGRAFFDLVREKADLCRGAYGLDLRFSAVLKSGGVFTTGRALKPTDIVRHGGIWVDGNPAWKPGLMPAEILAAGEPGCLVECTPSNLKTGEPGLGYMTQAFDRGWNVVAASKGALVVAFGKLRRMASGRDLALKFSAAAAAALPTLDTCLFSLAGTEIHEIQGILNGTSNYILTKMEEGRAYEDALREAQARGIAEPDPALDVGGWDTACKILLIANSALDLEACLEDVELEGIAGLSPDDLQRARKEGRVVKLLGTCTRASSDEPWRLAVRPQTIPASHPLAGVSGTNKGITFRTDTMGGITVTGGGSDPRATGAALLKDIINIYR